MNKTLRGDVETIALKALEKDRERRYQSAGELGNDIRRYFANEPITARPPSLVYQLKTFARKHRVIVGAAASMFVVILGALILTTVLYRETDRARVLAERGQAQTTAVTNLLVETLSAIEPAKAVGREVTVREMLDKAAAEIEDAFHDQPLVEAMMRTVLGRTYTALAQYPEAREHLQRSLTLRSQELGENALPFAETAYFLAVLLEKTGEFAEAERLHRRALETRRQRLGDLHPDVLASRLKLSSVFYYQRRYAEAEAWLRETLDMCRIVKDRPAEREALHDLALVLRDSAYLSNRTRRLAEARALFREALELSRFQFGDLHPSVANDLHGLALVHFDEGDYPTAEQALREAVDISRRLYPDGHERLAGALSTLGCVLMQEKAYDEAEKLFYESHRMYQSIYGDMHVDVAYPLRYLSLLYSRQGNDDRALAVLRQEVATLLRNDPAEDTYVTERIKALQDALLQRAQTQHENHDLIAAENLLREAIQLRLGTLGKDDLSTAKLRAELGGVLHEKGEFMEAKQMLRRALGHLGDDTLTTSAWAAAAQSDLGDALRELAHFEAAEQELLDAFRSLKNQMGLSHEITRRTAGRLVLLYATTGDQERKREFELVLSNRSEATKAQSP